MTTQRNIILATDSYKFSHFKQLPPGTTKMYSYVESRGGKFKEVLFFGLQAFIEDYLKPRVTMEMVDEAEAIVTAHGLPFDRAGWERIVKVHNGRIPVRISSVPEGTLVPTGVPLVTLESMDPELPWVAGHLETALLRAVWYPTTVATTSFMAKRLILKFLEETGDPSLIDFKLHDFGARGVSSSESAAIGGAAHLVNFKGTDTVESLLWLRKYYRAEMVGFSIPASEHSTITSWGVDREADAYANMIEQFGKPRAIFACVSDSYNIFNACEELWGGKLKDQVIASGATLVVRPDSGDPVDTVTRVVEILAEKFGTVTNNKGYKVLNTVRVIQGDGVNLDSIASILENLASRGFSADNIAFGMGGALLQAVDRDTQKFALKCSAALINDELVEVFKSPVGDSGKLSKAGILAACEDGDGKLVAGVRVNHAQFVEYTRAKYGGIPKNVSSIMVLRYNGDAMLPESLEEIRNRANTML